MPIQPWRVNPIRIFGFYENLTKATKKDRELTEILFYM